MCVTPFSIPLPKKCGLTWIYLLRYSGICCALLALAYLRLENKKREAGLRKETLGAQAANPKLRVFTGQHEAVRLLRLSRFCLAQPD